MNKNLPHFPHSFFRFRFNSCHSSPNSRICRLHSIDNNRSMLVIVDTNLTMTELSNSIKYIFPLPILILHSFFPLLSKPTVQIDPSSVLFVKKFFQHPMHCENISSYVEIKLTSVQSVDNSYDVHISLIIIKITVLL